LSRKPSASISGGSSRFGQLVYVLAKKNNCEDIFNPEDDEWLKWIKYEIIK